MYSCIAVGFATITSVPLNLLRERCGTPFVMIFGALCFSFVAIFAFILSNYIGNETLRNWMTLVYLVYGMGRAVWESTTKAVFALCKPGPYSSGEYLAPT